MQSPTGDYSYLLTVRARDTAHLGALLSSPKETTALDVGGVVAVAEGA